MILLNFKMLWISLIGEGSRIATCGFCICFQKKGFFYRNSFLQVFETMSQICLPFPDLFLKLTEVVIIQMLSWRRKAALVVLQSFHSKRIHLLYISHQQITCITVWKWTPTMAPSSREQSIYQLPYLKLTQKANYKVNDKQVHKNVNTC